MAAILISVDGINKLKTWLAKNEESIYEFRSIDFTHRTIKHFSIGLFYIFIKDRGEWF